MRSLTWCIIVLSYIPYQVWLSATFAQDFYPSSLAMPMLCFSRTIGLSIVLASHRISCTWSKTYPCTLLLAWRSRWSSNRLWWKQTPYSWAIPFHACYSVRQSPSLEGMIGAGSTSTDRLYISFWSSHCDLIPCSWTASVSSTFAICSKLSPCPCIFQTFPLLDLLLILLCLNPLATIKELWRVS